MFCIDKMTIHHDFDEVDFEWDEKKDKANQETHHVSFEEAKKISNIQNLRPGFFVTALPTEGLSLSASPYGARISESLVPPTGGRGLVFMNRKTTKPEGPIFDAEGYENAPEDVAQAIKTGTILPKDFLPPPEELVLRAVKETMTLRLDADVLDWFRGMGKGYQTKINAVLRAYKGAHEKTDGSTQKESISR